MSKSSNSSQSRTSSNSSKPSQKFASFAIPSDVKPNIQINAAKPPQSSGRFQVGYFGEDSSVQSPYPGMKTPELSVSERKNSVLLANKNRGIGSMQEYDELNFASKPQSQHRKLFYNNSKKSMQKNLSQVFQVSFEDQEQHRAINRERTNQLMVRLKQIQIAENPDELIDGMFEFIAEVGLNQAFIDQEEEFQRGNTTNPWQQMTNGLLNDKSLQATVFKQNLNKLLENKKALKILQKKQKEQQKRRNRKNQSQFYNKTDIDSNIDFSDNQTEKQSYQKSTPKNRRQTLKSCTKLSNIGNKVKFTQESEENVNVDQSLLKKWGFAKDSAANKYPEGFRGHLNKDQISHFRGRMEQDLKKMSIYSNDESNFNRMMAVFDKITKFQQSHVDLEKQTQKSEFKRQVLKILKSQRYNKKYRDIFQFDEKLPGISPVAEMISGDMRLVPEPTINPKRSEFQDFNKWKITIQKNIIGKFSMGNLGDYHYSSRKNSSQDFQSFMTTQRKSTNTQVSEQPQRDFNIQQNINRGVSELKSLYEHRQSLYEQNRPQIFKMLEKNAKLNQSVSSPTNSPFFQMRNNSELNFQFSPDTLQVKTDPSQLMFLRNIQKMKQVDHQFSKMAKMPIKINSTPRVQQQKRLKMPTLSFSQMDKCYDYCKNFKSGSMARNRCFTP